MPQNAKPIRMLVVEDDRSLARALKEGLEVSGFACTVACSAEEAWESLWEHPFDLILLDVGLPEGDDAGFEWAREVREAGFRQPILFLTARETLPDRVRGLEHGDDYVAKPFEMLELVARLKALNRRGEVRPQVVQWSGVTLKPDTREVLRDGELVRLTAKEYEVLELFMMNAGRIFTREEIIERVWGAGFDCPSNLVDVYVRNLRVKVGEGVLETVRGMGYRFSG